MSNNKRNNKPANNPTALAKQGGNAISNPKSNPNHSTQPAIFAHHSHTTEQFSGPIPHPELLARYNEVIPNGADRIMKMAEEQAAHRRELEKSVIKGDQERANRGLWSGFALSMSCLVGSVLTIYTGHDAAGLALFGGTAVTLVTTFVYGRRSQKKERERKERLLTGQEEK